jgi:hypothetical protein
MQRVLKLRQQDCIIEAAAGRSLSVGTKRDELDVDFRLGLS